VGNNPPGISLGTAQGRPANADQGTMGERGEGGQRKPGKGGGCTQKALGGDQKRGGQRGQLALSECLTQVGQRGQKTEAGQKGWLDADAISELGWAGAVVRNAVPGRLR